MSKPNSRFWTDKEREIVRDMFADNYTADICQLLGRGYGAVVAQAKKMGLTKSDAFRAMELQRQGERLRIAGAANRYVKGSVPMNKGQKMSNELKQKVAHTFFPKGNLPHNTKSDGQIVIRHDHYNRHNSKPYKWIRIALGEWQLLHRHTYEQAHGPIPKGHVVTFKNGDTLDCSLENLELLTMQENLIRNRNTYLALPENMQRTKQLIKQIKQKTITKKSKVK